MKNNMTLEEIKQYSKRKYFNAMNSNSYDEIDSTRQYMIRMMDTIIHDNLTQSDSDGAYDVITMLDRFEKALHYHGFNVARY